MLSFDYEEHTDPLIALSFPNAAMKVRMEILDSIESSIDGKVSKDKLLFS